MKTKLLGLALCAGCLLAATPSWAVHWAMIDGSDQRWWIDTDSISVDSGKGVTFFTEQMSDAAGTPPDAASTQLRIATTDQAIDCKSGQQYIYIRDEDDDGNDLSYWSKDQNKWPPEFWLSVRKIVCGGQNNSGSPPDERRK